METRHSLQALHGAMGSVWTVGSVMEELCRKLVGVAWLPMMASLLVACHFTRVPTMVLTLLICGPYCDVTCCHLLRHAEAVPFARWNQAAAHQDILCGASCRRSAGQRIQLPSAAEPAAQSEPAHRFPLPNCIRLESVYSACA